MLFHLVVEPELVICGIMSSDGLPFSPFTRRAGIGLERGAKSLLRNVIRHTDTHNRVSGCKLSHIYMFY